MNRLEKICHRYEFEVAFSDTDASGRVHFSKMLGYAERAEHEFLTAAGIDVFDPGKQGWPRVRVSCDFVSALKFGDRAEVCLGLSKVGSSSLHWKFEIVDEEAKPIAVGEMMTVKVNGSGVATALSDGERETLEGSL